MNQQLMNVRNANILNIMVPLIHFCILKYNQTSLHLRFTDYCKIEKQYTSQGDVLFAKCIAQQLYIIETGIKSELLEPFLHIQINSLSKPYNVYLMPLLQIRLFTTLL